MAKTSTKREETAQDIQVLLLAEAYWERVNHLSKTPNKGSIWPTDYQLAVQVPSIVAVTWPLSGEVNSLKQHAISFESLFSYAITPLEDILHQVLVHVQFLVIFP